MMKVVVVQHGFFRNLLRNIYVKVFDVLYTVILWVFFKTTFACVLLLKINYYLTKW